MKKTLITASIALIVFSSCMEKQKEASSNILKEKPTSEISIARGEYLVNAMGCDDCHSPKKMGEFGPEVIEELRFSGYPADRPKQPIDKNNLKMGWVLFNPDLTSAIGPWGQSYAANITSDATGIGNWSEENFMLAIRKGKYKGLESSRNLLPPMPWMVYKNLTDEDLKSIFSFLQTTKPVSNIVPAAVAPGNLN